MKLSMSLLAWYLRDQNPVCQIQDDNLCIRGLRFVMDDIDTMQPEYAYFGQGSNFFTDQQYAETYLVVNHRSILLFKDADFNMLLNALLSAFDYFNSWEADLLNAGARNAPLQEFVDIASTVFENPLAVGSLDMNLIVSSDLTGHRVDPLWRSICAGTAGINPVMYEQYIDEVGGKVLSLSDKPQIVRNVYEGGDPVIMLYLPQGESVAGYVSILQENSALTMQNLQLAPIFARFCLKAEELVSESGYIQSGANLFKHILEGDDIGPDNADRFSKSLPRPPWRLLALQVSGRSDDLAASALLSNLKHHTDCHFPTRIGKTCFCIVEDRIVSQIDPLQGASSIGASAPFSNIDVLPTRRQQAEFALGQSGDLRGVFLCEDYACNYLLKELGAMESTPALLHPAMEMLDRYDEENQSDLRVTLSMYLQCERNQLVAAQNLHIHPNTMRYRLRRIREIAGLTLEDENELRYLRLSDWLSS